MKKFLATVLSLCMVLTMLPIAVMAANYTDTDGHWGEAAIDRWSDEGIVEGYEDGSFAPDKYMNRAEVAAALSRLLNLSAKADLSKYTDADQIADWALEAMAWANAEGIITGKTETTLAPTETSNRAQLATILVRYIAE